MLFVTGGTASGKRTFARSLGFADGNMAVDAQELVRIDTDITALADKLACKKVVIATEVGSGVVPLDPDERAYRDRAGRLAAELASRADAAVRMVCGIPVVLKGDPWSLS